MKIWGFSKALILILRMDSKVLEELLEKIGFEETFTVLGHTDFIHLRKLGI